MKRPTIFLSIACAGVVAVLARPPPRHFVGSDIALLPRKEFLTGIGKAYQSVVVDYLWVQMLQQISRGSSGPELLPVYSYADLITDVDPQFFLVYKYAGLILPWNTGHEHWVNTAESTRIIKKGLHRFPGDMSLLMAELYNEIYFTRDFDEAAKVATELTQFPTCPPFVGQLATRLYSQAGKFDVGISLAEQMRDSAVDADTRQFFETRIRQLRLEQTLRQIDEALAHFQHSEGRPAATIRELLSRGYIQSEPNDPFGGEIIIGQDGRTHSSVESERLEIKALLKEDVEP